MKIQLLPTHRRDFFKRRPAGERKPRTCQPGPRGGPSGRAPFAPARPGAAPPVLLSPSAVVELPQLVQESESLSPLVRRRLPRRVCHYFFKGGLKKNPDRCFKSAPRSQRFLPEPGAHSSAGGGGAQSWAGGGGGGGGGGGAGREGGRGRRRRRRGRREQEARGRGGKEGGEFLKKFKEIGAKLEGQATAGSARSRGASAAPTPSFPPSRGPALARLSAPPAREARPGDAIQHGAAAGGARAGEGKGEPTVRGRGGRRPGSFGGRGGGGGAGAGGAGGGEGEVCVVVCGKRGDSVYSGRSSAGPSHTFTRGLAAGASPGRRHRRQPSRCAPPARSLPSPPASLSAASSVAATAGQPEPHSDPRGPAAALRLTPHRPGSSSRGTIDWARRA